MTVTNTAGRATAAPDAARAAAGPAARAAAGPEAAGRGAGRSRAGERAPRGRGARGRVAVCTATVLAGAAVLTACGGSGGSDGDKIAGGSPAPAATTAGPTPSATGTAPAGAPAIRLPADVKVSITDPGPGKDTATTKAISDLEYAIRALIDGTAQGDGNVPSMRYAYAGQAGVYWSQRIAAVKQSGQTITGTYRYYRIDAALSGQGVLGHYCEDQSKAFGKDIKTGKVNRNPPSDKSYLYYTVSMFKNAAGTWQVAQVNWTKGAKQCLSG